MAYGPPPGGTPPLGMPLPHLGTAAATPRVPLPMGAWLSAFGAGLQFRAAASGRIAGVSLLAGLATDRLLQAGGPGIGFTLFWVMLAGGVAGAAATRSWQAQVLAVAVALLGVSYTLLASPWVQPLGFLVILASLLVAASLARGGDLLDLPWSEVTLRVVSGGLSGMLGFPWIERRITKSLGRFSPSRHAGVFRGVLLAIPLLVVFVLLLASADPVFSSLFDVKLDVGSVGPHAFLFLFGALVFAGLLRIATVGEVPSSAPVSAPRLGGVEAMTVLASIAALFAVFTATQIAAAFGAGRDLLVREGITYSDYARSGYFQLLAVVVLVTILLPLFQHTAKVDASRGRWIRGLAVLVVVLTLGIAAVAARRLALYDDAYGLTMLRLGAVVGGIWFSLLLVFLGLAVAGVFSRKAWFPGAALISLIVVTGSFMVLNPEAYIVRYDVAHASSAHLDVPYLLSLSDDSIPALVAAVPAMDAAAAAQVRTVLCARDRQTMDWMTWSASRHAADDALRALCS